MKLNVLYQKILRSFRNIGRIKGVSILDGCPCEFIRTTSGGRGCFVRLTEARGMYRVGDVILVSQSGFVRGNGDETNAIHESPIRSEGSSEQIQMGT